MYINNRGKKKETLICIGYNSKEEEEKEKKKNIYDKGKQENFNILSSCTIQSLETPLSLLSFFP